MSDSIQADAFRALTTALKADPTLRGPRGVKTWRDRCGRPNETAEPTAQECPWVRLTLVGLPTRAHARTVEAQPAKVVIETAVAGANAVASANLWGLIRAAIWGPGPEAQRLRESIRAAGAVQVILRTPALPKDPKDYGDLTRAEGDLELSIFVRTRPPHIP